MILSSSTNSHLNNQKRNSSVKMHMDIVPFTQIIGIQLNTDNNKKVHLSILKIMFICHISVGWLVGWLVDLVF